MQQGEQKKFQEKEFSPFLLDGNFASLQLQVPQQSVAYEEAYNRETKV
jgi:hypothetical protein